MSNTVENEELEYFTESITSKTSNNEAGDPASSLTEVAEKVRKVPSFTGFFNIVVILIGTVVGGYFGYTMMANQGLSQIPETGSTSQLTVEDQPGASNASKAVEMLDAAVAAASVYFSEKNTFKGFKPGKPIRVAANTESIVMVVEINGECYSNGIATGYDSVTRFDPSGNRCDPENFKNLQKIMKNK